VETLPPLVRLGMCRAGAGVAGRGERWIPDGEMASAKWHAGACGAILIAWSALFPAGSVIGSSRRTLRQWCSGGVGLVLQAWHCGRSCGAGTHLRYPVVPAVRGRTCATLWLLRCAACGGAVVRLRLAAWQQVAGEGWFVLNRRWIGNCGLAAAVFLSTCSSDFLIGHD